jgi:hypothetical protein
MTESAPNPATEPDEFFAFVTLRIATDAELPIHERVAALDELRAEFAAGEYGPGRLDSVGPELRTRLVAFLASPPPELVRSRTARHPRGRPRSMLDDAHEAIVAAFILACRKGVSVEAAREATCEALPNVSDRSIDRWVARYAPMRDMPCDVLVVSAGGCWPKVQALLRVR